MPKYGKSAATEVEKEIRRYKKGTAHSGKGLARPLLFGANIIVLMWLPNTNAPWIQDNPIFMRISHLSLA